METYPECQDCGKSTIDVKVRACPYGQEINDETIMVEICDFCYGERGDAI